MEGQCVFSQFLMCEPVSCAEIVDTYLVVAECVARFHVVEIRDLW